MLGPTCYKWCAENYFGVSVSLHTVLQCALLRFATESSSIKLILYWSRKWINSKIDSALDILNMEIEPYTLSSSVVSKSTTPQCVPKHNQYDFYGEISIRFGAKREKRYIGYSGLVYIVLRSSKRRNYRENPWESSIGNVSTWHHLSAANDHIWLQ